MSSRPAEVQLQTPPFFWLTSGKSPKVHYTRPFLSRSLLFPHTHFLSQSAPDIKCKFQSLKDELQTPQKGRSVLPLTFSVMEIRKQKMNDLKGIRLNARCWWQLSRAPRGTSTALGAEPSRPCLKCRQEGHWAKGGPNPRPPPGPCPCCSKGGHCKVDCDLPLKGRSHLSLPKS